MTEVTVIRRGRPRRALASAVMPWLPAAWPIVADLHGYWI